MSSWFIEALKLRDEGNTMTYIATELGLHYDTVRKRFKRYDNSLLEEEADEESFVDMDKTMLGFAKKKTNIYVIAEKLGMDVDEVRKIFEEMRDEGYQIYELEDNTSTLSTKPIETCNQVETHWDGIRHFKFGVVSDTHLCSNNQQLTFLNDVYDIFEQEGIKDVYHSGDILDGYGMRKGQEFEVFKHGADAQIKYCIDKYPEREGITTKFITGNHDHSFIKSAGLDVGYQIAKERKDLEYLGRSHARIYLTDNCTLDLVHPIDGSSYALSYGMQKYIEALNEGDVPTILLCGHHHKFVNIFYRGVWASEVPTTQAQTDFMRGKRLVAYVGAMIIEVSVDQEGFVTEYLPRFIPCKNIIKNDF